MAVQTYECLFLVDPNRASADPEGVQRDLNDLVTRNGGTIIDSRPWGDPKLAYPIKKFRKGTYYLMYFTGPGSMLTQFEADCRLAEFLLRHLIIKLHPHVAAEVVAHIRGEIPVGPGHANLREEPIGVAVE